MKKRISLYLGCIIPHRYPGMEVSARKVLEHLGVEICDIPGATCCPPDGIFKAFHQELWLTMAARNIALAERNDADIITICNGCYSTLSDANRILKKDTDTRNRVNEHLSKIDLVFNGTIDVKHIAELLYYDIGPDRIRASISNPLGLRVAVHYGCHLLYPSAERKCDNPDYNPEFLDELVALTGAESIDYRDKGTCCGAGGGVRKAAKESALEATTHKLSYMRDAGVDCLLVVCPLCYIQFDRSQKESSEKHNIPVVSYTQLLALAQGESAVNER
jgi:heterodisulfide reductase subunit B